MRGAGRRHGWLPCVHHVRALAGVAGEATLARSEDWKNGRLLAEVWKGSRTFGYEYRGAQRHTHTYQYRTCIQAYSIELLACIGA